jgi:hypothetical protein
LRLNENNQVNKYGQRITDVFQPRMQPTHPVVKRIMKVKPTLIEAVSYNPENGHFYPCSASKLGLLSSQHPTIQRTYIRDQLRTAQVGDVSEIPSTETLGTVLGVARPRQILRNICKVIPNARREFWVDKTSLYQPSAKVTETETPELVSPTFEREEFTCWKNEIGILVADEVAMSAGGRIPVFQLQDAGKALAYLQNQQIAEVAETAEAISGNDWGGTNNPLEDIMSAIDVIEVQNGFECDFVVAADRVWSDFFTNQYVKSGQTKIPQQQGFVVPGLPNQLGYSDNELTNTIALVGSTRAPALVLADAPTEILRFRCELLGADGYVIRQWMEVKMFIPGAIRRLTGVHA